MPVPVCAQAIRSLPCIITGMAMACMGVGVVYPMAFNPSAKCSLKLKSSKVTYYIIDELCKIAILPGLCIPANYLRIVTGPENLVDDRLVSIK